jgi:hypothetical protein
MWPDFDEFKHELESWLRTHHPNYLNEIGEREWTNLFCGKHHSSVIITNYQNIWFRILYLILFLI